MKLVAFLAAIHLAGAADAGFRLVDVTAKAGLKFRHNNGAFGKKYLPETLGPGCAFLDYDNDGWQDVLFANGTNWPGRSGAATTIQLYRNNRDGTFRDVSQQSGLGIAIYAMGLAAGDFNNDGFVDVFVSAVGQSRLFQNTSKGTFTDVTRQSGLWGKEAFSSSALWVDYNRDGLLDLLVANYVRWSIDQDVYCTIDGKQKSYCTPEAYRGASSWLFRNSGGGRFEDVTAKSGLFDTSSKSLGAAVLDYDNDGWPDIFIANDTQPNKLYRNLRNGKFEETGVRAGVA
ncbi:MAG TPA: VCBS repeat-containing protein, partial [Bryobacteraceae bacterium]|nr:VCBS repeat-containing protein [Bryobacteraceae bacterium]